MKKLLSIMFLLAVSAFGQHSVTLNWVASASQDATGYNVYRGTTSGGPYSQLNVFRITALTYTDASVQPGVTYYYVATAVNASGESIYSNQATAVIPPAPVITCGTAPTSGIVGQAYSKILAPSSGVPPYVISISAGALPDGLTLNTTTGGLTGTPTKAGTFSFTDHVTDSSNTSGSSACSITIAAAPVPVAVSCNNPPAGIVGTAYTHTFSASGGTGPYTYAITTGALPTGLTLASNGGVSGTPSVDGTFNYTVRATDSLAATSTASCSIVIQPIDTPLSVSCNNPPSGIVGTAYSHNSLASAGTAPYTFAIGAGALPDGLSLATSGAITGTPTANGTFSYTLDVTDSLSGSGSAACSVQVVQPLTISCNGPASGIVGQPYSYTFPVAGGTAPYTSSIVGGQLPSGLTWDGSTSTLAGTFSAAGSYIYSIRVGDSGSLTQSVTCGTSISVLLPYIPPRTTIPQTVLVRPIGSNDLVLPLASLNGLLPFAVDLRTRTFGAFIDKEWTVMTHPPTMTDLQAVGSTVLLHVFRGAFGGRAANHKTGSVVWYGPTEYFKTTHPPRACDTSQEAILPWIDVVGGGIYDCTNSRWVRR